MNKLKFVVQRFDSTGNFMDSVVCSNAEQIREETEKLIQKGAKEVIVSVTELRAY